MHCMPSIIYQNSHFRIGQGRNWALWDAREGVKMGGRWSSDGNKIFLRGVKVIVYMGKEDILTIPLRLEPFNRRRNL